MDIHFINSEFVQIGFRIFFCFETNKKFLILFRKIKPGIILQRFIQACLFKIRVKILVLYIIEDIRKII